MDGISRRTRLAAVLIALAALGAPAAVSSPAGAATRAVDVNGRLLVTHADNFTTGMATMTFQLDTGRTRVAITAPSTDQRSLHNLASRPVRVRGTRQGATIAATSIAPAAASQSDFVYQVP